MGLHFRQGPGEIDRGRPRAGEPRGGFGESRVARVKLGGDGHAIRGGGADERRAAHPHVTNGLGGGGEIGQGDDDESVR